jgi:hypothetical protein
MQDASMSTSAKDKKTAETKDASPEAGRIVHDSRGNAVWKWGKGSDSSSTATTSKMLRKLDIGNLRLEDAAQAESPPETKTANKKGATGYGPGYNPYDRTAPVRRMPPKK